ncbi:p10 [Apocheima cinerarium nucleopolyhedrovirus]|uniref:p10 n=1 Tax=Apocheima cinerarium nucleopolyhedrovirus TaxID=307461 RepID=UPI0001D920C9|nr:p10 [Apocheima cinerarium nucleopolyhedrovirus]ADB84462.1 p10 [Apocheima cinerarium nucleopolyhedrovirus]
MSQNILVLIRNDVKEVDTKVTALQDAVADIQGNLPDVTEINDKLDAQTTALATLQTAVDAINAALNPDVPDVPDVPIPSLRTKLSKKQ